jgi:hypothetical protein
MKKSKLFFAAAILLLVGAGAYAAKHAEIDAEVYYSPSIGVYISEGVQDLPCHQGEGCVDNQNRQLFYHPSGSFLALGND